MIMVPSSVFHATRPDAEKIQVYLNHNNVAVSFSNTKIAFQEYMFNVIWLLYELWGLLRNTLFFHLSIFNVENLMK